MSVPIYTYIILPVLLILSGLFSGLNLGLMSLDKIGLEIVLGSGTEAEKRYAKGLLPLRKQGNLLLCTLLLGNTAVNAILAILMADLTGGLIGTLSTTFGIVIFGEIVPQSLCSRNGLAIGYYTRHIVIFFMVVLWIIAAPIALCLDYILEEEIGSVYNREQMMKLFEIHAGQRYGDLVTDEVTILKGVLQLAKKTVCEIMTPIDEVFMLDINARMDFKNMERILAKGHSRIPVYDGDKDNVYKLLLVKNMIMLNPGDEVPLRSLLQEGFPEPLYVSPTTTLDQMLNEFQMGGSHLAIISKSSEEFQKSMDSDKKGAAMRKITRRKNVGIVTLEDVIETLIQEPIKDETEGKEGVGQKFLKVLRKKNKFKSSTLSTSEGRAIASFLQGMFQPFRLEIIGAHAIEKLVQMSEIIQLKPNQGSTSIYTISVPVDFCCLILDGSLRITVGLQKFQSDAGIWKMLALHSLTTDNYKPDFTATVVQECTILKIRREDYRAAIEGKLVARSIPKGATDLASIKHFASPTVTALRKQYGNEVEFAEEMKYGPQRRNRLAAPETDIQFRSKSTGDVTVKGGKGRGIPEPIGEESSGGDLHGSNANGSIPLVPIVKREEKRDTGRNRATSADSEGLLAKGRVMSDDLIDNGEQ
uniref:CNNM transmembrane domain-containing protein n=1 Tax=Lotharella oceanica TaxID=641309 RepID=A0A7S2XFU7_9EUKA|mmetsp:Transcript_31738/g.59163  ORF Transcript_31738/g.59163 Transcript_31738/m.59163 type:complete len:644 (+) Transcript_31738:28-1959(+)